MLCCRRCYSSVRPSRAPLPTAKPLSVRMLLLLILSLTPLVSSIFEQRSIYYTSQNIQQTGQGFQGNLPPSPCPDVFQYQYEGNQWVGVVTVPPPPLDFTSRNQIIRINVSFTLGLRLSSSYVGEVKLRLDDNTVAKNLISGSNEPLEYLVIFPVQSPLPLLNNVQVNGQILCQDNPVVNGAWTTLYLSRELVTHIFPSGAGLPQKPFQQQNQQPQPQFIKPTFIKPTFIQTTPYYVRLAPVFNPQPTPLPAPPVPVFIRPSTPRQRPPAPVSIQPTTSRPATPAPVTISQTIPPTLEQTTQMWTNKDSCGEVISSYSLQLVVKGYEVQPNEWPWLVALYKKSTEGLETFTCGSSLVSHSHVITAAHCVTNKRTKKEDKADSLVLYLGKHSLKSTTDPSIQSSAVDEIQVHPNYNENNKKDDFDIAILVLSTRVHFSLSVRPVCLWGPETVETAKSTRGMVVGWGMNEKGEKMNDVPIQVLMPVVTNEECVGSNDMIGAFVSINTYCAGSKNGSGACTGDSGGGMYVREVTPKKGARWMLRGVVSLSLKDQETGSCDLNSYSVFTDVIQLSKWIRGVMLQ